MIPTHADVRYRPHHVRREPCPVTAPLVAPLIVVVDDDRGVVQALDGLLRSLGYRVAAFDCVAPFLASAAADAVACVISDLRMPGDLDGIDLALALRGRVAVILMSAFLDAGARRRAEAAGVFAVLDKPCAPGDLVRHVARAVAAARPLAS